MHLHLVGGFLGSGKTTAIIEAAKLLMRQGKKVGVITNDQGKYLVDTAFFLLNAIPAVEVTGGCFCCNYDDLEQRLDQLQHQVTPDVIFAESVGSCGDLVATVIEPLQRLRGETPPTSFSVFADVRLLHMRLLDEELPFSETVVYIFDKQIEEAPLLVVNKTDLVEPGEAAEAEWLARQRFPEKDIRMQSSIDPGQIAGWVEMIEAGRRGLPSPRIEMDYARYGEGEAQLAWLDQEIHIQASGGGVQAAVVQYISEILAEIRRERAAIGHLKCLVAVGGTEIKISIPTLEPSDWPQELDRIESTEATVLVNARIEMSPERLRSLARNAMVAASAKTGAVFAEKKVDFFQPKFPNPTHRFGS